MVNDPIGDFIIRLKNASMAGRTEVSVPFSKVKYEIAQVLIREGFLASAEKKGKKINKFLDVAVKYSPEGAPEIRGVKRISKLGKRVYVKAKEIFPVKFGHGITVISTPNGLKTDKEARKEKVGGEAMFSIW